jgi:putative ABC transport system permease protein
MITAVFVAVASFVNLFGNVELLSSGDIQAHFYVNMSQVEELKNDENISDVGVKIDEEDTRFELDSNKSNHLKQGSIYCADSVNLKQIFTCDYDGNIPQNENEIAVEQSLIDKNDLDWNIGDTVKISVGHYSVNDGVEVFEPTNEYQYKITAILHDNAPTSNYSIIKGCDLNNLNLGVGELVDASITLKNTNYKSLDVINDIISKYNIQEYDINKDYLETKFAIDKDSSLMTSIIPMATIILVLIMIASVILIYNAFGMSLSERVRYLGMLASVGATKKQKRQSVYFEGFILGSIGIPVGIVAGIIGIGITLKTVGKKIIETGMLSGVTDTNMNMKVVVPIWAIIAIVIFSVLTIFISSFIPSRKASNITPIDAIKQNSEININGKKLKSPKLIRKIFAYEGELAYKNLKRNGRKSRVIVASIALSIILFLSCNYFCQLFMQANNLAIDIPYQLEALVSYGQKDNFESSLDSIDGVDKYYCVNNTSISGEIEGEIANKDYLTPTYKNLFDSENVIYVNEIDDNDFNNLCADNNIDYKQFYEGDAKALIMNNISHKNNSSRVFNDKIIGTDYVTGNVVEADESSMSVEIVGLVNYDANNYVCNLNPKNTISIYVPYSAYYSAIFSESDTGDWSYYVGIETDQHEEVTESIKNLFDEYGYSGYVSDYLESFKAMNTIIYVLKVFVYGFIVLITMITIANIINTISTGIALRRKEFAMLKSVGTTPKGFTKMISLESAFYGMKAVIFGIPISLLISFAINKALGENTIPFEINWLLYIAVILIVFAIVGMSMFYSVSKLKDDSIIETLKEDIL